MLDFFPRPLPDELLYSTTARYHILRGSLSHTPTRQVFAGSTTKAVNPLLPKNLKNISEMCGQGSPYTPKYFVENHTLLPFFRFFMEQDVYQKVEALCLGNTSFPIPTLMGWSRFKVPTFDGLKYCLKCVKEDSAEYGLPYWHRTHQLPQVYVCLKHEEPLCKHQYKNKQSDEVNFFLPTTSNGSDYAANINSDRQFDQHLNFGLLSQEVLFKANKLVGPDRLVGTYKIRLFEKNLLRGDNVNQKMLHLTFVQKYGASFLKDLSVDIPENAKNKSWLSKMFTKTEHNNHYVEYLLVGGLLYECLSDLLAQLVRQDNETVSATEKEVVIVKDRRKIIADDSEKTGMLLEYLMVNQHEEIESIASRFGIGRSTCSAYALGMGIVKREHNRERVLNENARIFDLLNRGMSSSDVAREAGVAIHRVIAISKMNGNISKVRFVNLRNKHRQLLLEARRTYPKATRSQLMTDGQYNAKSSYRWLSENDRGWLEKNLPTPVSAFCRR